jgi:hypothetical protein
MKKRLYIQLGRSGDILNVLPLLRRDFEVSGIRPLLLVAEQYRPLLDGVGYAEPFVWRGDFADLAGAWPVAERIAETNGAEIVCTQIYGNNVTTVRTASSFVRQSWDQSPGAPPWGTLPLVFDRRDPTREAGVSNLLTRNVRDRPYIVLALSGESSPFPHAGALANYIRTKLRREFAIVDVSGFIAPRFYDLLDLLENAHAIVAVDSGVLHLAYAAPFTPVVAFVTREPTPWHGTAWRPQHVARFFYDEAPECFARVVDRLFDPLRDPPYLYHVWSRFGPVDEETARRMELARATWQAEYTATGRWIPRGIETDVGFETSAKFGDPRPVGFVRDAVDHAADGIGSSDIIAWTNADVCLTPGITGWAIDHCARAGAAFTHRWDFDRLDEPFRSESEVIRGDWYPGSDAFFFTAGWWRRHRNEYPDMLIGREQCDEVLRQLIKRHGGLEIHGAVYHERHASFWEAGANRETNPGNVYNRKLARKWFLRTGYGPNDPEWWAIPTPRD